VKIKKQAKKEIEELEARIVAYQEMPARENERRVRIGGNFEDAVKKMSSTPPVSSDDIKAWAKKQREDTED
tara:strand:+ start:2999 stop:3211 length:213 start_codon:yes stop_codon:yes gene_type:complete